MSPLVVPSPPIRSAARTSPACLGDRLSLGGITPPLCAPRTPGAALRAPARTLPRRLQLRPTAS